MEFDVTDIIEATRENPLQFSASRAELGWNAPQQTWNNAKDYAEERDSLGGDELEHLRSYFLTFGAWDIKELQEMSGFEIHALLVQCVSGEYRELAEGGETPGCLYQADIGEHAGRWFYYAGV